MIMLWRVIFRQENKVTKRYISDLASKEISLFVSINYRLKTELV